MNPTATRVEATALVDLVARAKAGDAEALDGLVRAMQDDIYRLALRMRASPEDAEGAPYSGSVSPVDPVSTSARTISRILSGSTIRGRQGGHQ